MLLLRTPPFLYSKVPTSLGNSVSNEIRKIIPTVVVCDIHFFLNDEFTSPQFIDDLISIIEESNILALI